MGDRERLKRTAAGVTVTSLILGTASLVAANTATAVQDMTATTWVNMRSAPGGSSSVLDVLAPREVVTTTGSTVNGWHQVVTADGVTGWVSRHYLTGVSGSTAASKGSSTTATSAAAAAASTGTATTSAAVNVRSGAGTSYPTLGVAARGTTIPTTGKTSGSWWTQVVWNGRTAWISTSYLTAGSAAAPARPESTTPVARPSAPTAPATAGTATVTAGALNVRSGPSNGTRIVGTVYRNASLPTTGKSSGSWVEVVHQGTARWVHGSYLRTGSASSAPAPVESAPASSLVSTSRTLAQLNTSGISRLTPSALRVAETVAARFPGIKTVYGWRASSNYSSDHPNGRAVDVMVANYRSQSQINLGWDVARHFQNNAKQYNVSYIIWRQQIWNANYPERGWRAMENRGDDTANHYDHVHISVRS